MGLENAVIYSDFLHKKDTVIFFFTSISGENYSQIVLKLHITGGDFFM